MAFTNGVSAVEITGVTWLKARASVGAGECVEVASLPDGEVAVRNSRHPEGPALIFTKAELRAFLEGAKCAEFDNLAA
ncbi:DUF397 domain-containing protein [Streptomyces noursei]|uniref:DUF397 domain-containing protein n=1 Tax=Streptomyces noursei TaxID=1971 RepID=UPI0016718FBF|nr:DUF397 domain-containing protein [Streptomyces noursei]MCZ1019802.1 DUF397 domain-containing protein [Streptomyces noursei]GGX36533.1 hypothetical protein GCM10010341_67650 [Streptomyces noursei]